LEAHGWLEESPPRDPRDVLSGASSADMTVAMLINDFLEKYVEAKGLRSGAEIRRRLLKNVTPLIGPIRLADLHRRDVVRVVDAIMKRGRQIEANRVFRTDARNVSVECLPRRS